MEYSLGILGVVIWLLVMKLLKKKEGTKDAVSRNSASRSANRWHTEKLPGAGSSRRPVRASDGHILSEMRDITCRQFGHNHSKWAEPATRYIVHDDPEQGYIILNGKKMRISEADKYENSI